MCVCVCVCVCAVFSPGISEGILGAWSQIREHTSNVEIVLV